MSNHEPSTVDPEQSQASSSLAFDADKYLAHVEDFQMTETQKVEFLRALWDIMSTFVRVGFGVESVLPTIFQRALETPADGIEQSILTHEFNVAADAENVNKENKEKKEEPS